MASTLTSCLVLGLLLQTQGSSALELSEQGHAEAVMSSAGMMARVGGNRKSTIVRRDILEHEDGALLEQASDYDRTAKTKQSVNPTSRTANSNTYQAPHWAPHELMMTLPTNCTSKVGLDDGISDYGKLSHSCTACASSKSVTDGNKQQDIEMTMLIDPLLSSCNAFELTYYVNWSSIDGLECSTCDNKGIRHAMHTTIASNAGNSAPQAADNTYPVYSFEAWMGPEADGASSRTTGAGFVGRHVFEIADTVEPGSGQNCAAEGHDHAARWIAMPGQSQAAENFVCTRVCKSETWGVCDDGSAISCGRTTHTRCEAAMTMGTGQIFEYTISREAADQTVTYEGTSRTGSEWVVMVKDLVNKDTNGQPKVETAGRIVLEGLGSEYGIKEVKQSHQHIGLDKTPCDLFYESTTVVGPFITQPAGVHAVRSASGNPPTPTSSSCELFRMSSYNEPGSDDAYGTTIHFETGPGLWPPTQVANTLLNCQTAAGTTCPNTR